jgi:hypothetical protein
MPINRGGFQETTNGVEISKAPTARLTYTLDWSDWLEGADTITTATFTANSRRNDPTPVTIHTSGIQSGDKTYVEISGGQVDKVYIITCAIVTTAGLIDNRKFRLRVEDRYA